MKTKVIKIHYPSLTAEEIGGVTAAVREQVLEKLTSARISYSFSSKKNTGYIMVYASDPVLSIRISDHETDKSIPSDELIIEEGNTTSINAEVENGQRISEAILAEALVEAERKTELIREAIKNINYE